MSQNGISLETIADNQAEVPVESANGSITSNMGSHPVLESGPVSQPEPLELKTMSERTPASPASAPVSANSAVSASDESSPRHAPDVRLLAKAVTNHLGGRSEDALRTSTPLSAMETRPTKYWPPVDICNSNWATTKTP